MERCYRARPHDPVGIVIRLHRGGHSDGSRQFVAPKDLRYVRLHIDDPNSVDHYARIPEFEVIGRPLAQLRVGVRGGYQFSTTDSFGSEECDLPNEALRPCSRFVTEVYASASLLGFVRFQLAGVYEPKLHDDQQNLFSLRPTIGIQLNSPF